MTSRSALERTAENLMGSPAPTPYDARPYVTRPRAQTHPDRLATVATLFGLAPPPVTRCRVLEIGCGDGGNLVPMAYTLPGSRFVGIDLASAAIARGVELIGTLGLENVELRCLDLMDVTPALGTFDYVIAHGVYSWVPAPVRDRLLAICRAHLDPRGIAYVSYNTYPGCHLRDAARRVLRFHVEGIADPDEQIEEARALARFLAESPGVEAARALREEFRQVLDRSPSTLFHDDLAPVNDPVYFHEFVEHARRHRLGFVAEANVWEMQERAFPESVGARLRELSDGGVVLREQYADFLRNRRFRQTLLCHEALSPAPALLPGAAGALFVASAARPVPDQADLVSPSAAVEFRVPGGPGLSTAHPLARAALAHLGTIWPRAIGLPDLVRQAHRILGMPGGEDPARPARALGDLIVSAYSAHVAELFTVPSAFTLEVRERPVASAVAREQARRGDDLVASLRHGGVRLEDPFARHLLCLLDGTRDRAALLAEMQGFIASRVSSASPLTEEAVEGNLTGLARLALLVG
jgi:SAM-dependent methyltransferase